MTGTKWMVSIEGKVVCQLKSSCDSFATGLAVMFGCYYNYNLHYQEAAGSTLEFIQRYRLIVFVK
jgi:hypothetical protein